MEDKNTQEVTVNVPTEKKREIDNWADEVGISPEDAYSVLLHEGWERRVLEVGQNADAATEPKQVHLDFVIDDANRILAAVSLVLFAAVIGFLGLSLFP